MCLSVPAEVISIDGQNAEVKVCGESRRVYLATDGAQPGSWVLIHGGIALCVLAPEVAQETISLLAVMSA